MRSTRSRGIEIDYRILNSTGERVPRIVEDQMASKHLIQISTLADNIIDFIDENGPNETGDNVDAIDKAVGKAEVLRNEYRMQLKEAQVEFGEKFKELFGKESIIILDQLKDHIKSLKQHTISIHQSRSKIKTNPFKTTFLTDEIERISNDLEIVWTTTDLSENTRLSNRYNHPTLNSSTIASSIENSKSTMLSRPLCSISSFQNSMVTNVQQTFILFAQTLKSCT